MSEVIDTKNKHPHPANERQNEKRILCDRVKNKTSDDWTQKPTKLIRTELPYST